MWIQLLSAISIGASIIALIIFVLNAAKRNERLFLVAGTFLFFGMAFLALSQYLVTGTFSVMLLVAVLAFLVLVLSRFMRRKRK